MSRFPVSALLAGMLCFAGGHALAQKTARDISVETFFKRAQYEQMSLSPSGGKLAALSPIRGRNNLVVIDVAKRSPRVVTSFDSVDVTRFYWINDERLCMSVGDAQDATGQFNYRGTYCIDHDGQNIRDITKIGVRNAALGGYTQFDPVHFLDDGTPNVIAAINLRTRYSEDLYRFNTVTGKTELLTFDSPGWVEEWVVDQQGVPRVAVSRPDFHDRPDKNRLLKQQVWYREADGAKWELLGEHEVLVEPMGEYMLPVAFDHDGTTLFVTSNAGGRDKAALFKYDTKSRKLGELVFEHPLVDVRGGLVFSRTERKLLGVRYNAEKPSVKWFDPDMDRLQRQIDATFPRTINVIGMPRQSKARALVFAHSDVDPGTYHLLDRTKPSLEVIARTREWIDPALMSERRFIKYKARDGLEIPAWVTIPKGSGGKNLPLIVNVHGGPFSRGYSGVQWGRWPEAQFFASRGYAVLEPEPRNSTGFGTKHFTSGLRQWGQAMQDDINDGALYLVQEGIADKNRMCIHGGSYGGYAAAMGVTRDPDFWRCASPFVAVTDLFVKFGAAESDASAEYLRTDARRLVGDPEKDKAMFEKYSPALQADKAKAPVLLAMGSDDRRVPIVHGERFNSALLAAGKKVEYVIYPGEGHGFNKDVNVIDFYTRLERFFAENLK